jgi:tetratricopeptide (TPR) repeat protein
MKKFWCDSQSLVLALLMALAAQPAIAQTQNPQALNFFKTAVNENDPEKKIAAYKQAIARDSLFVEAFYNLGLAYKKQQDYASAERYLYKAYHTNPGRIKNELKLQILYELATTYRRLGKLKDCEDALSGAKGLATDENTRAMILFELGRCLFERGRYQEALAELRAGERLAPSRGENFKSFIQIVESAFEARQLGEEAEKAVAGGNLERAKTLLNQLKNKNPGTKEMEAMIAGLESRFGAETAKSQLAVLYDQAQKHAAEGNWELAISTYESLLQQAANYKDANARLEEARQQLEQKQISQQLENDYAAGLAALKTRDWTKAILAFEKILGQDPNYRDAQQRLDEARSELERESTETIIARYYADGVAALDKNDLGGALVAFEKVRKLDPQYREVSERLREIEAHLQKNAERRPTPAGSAALAQQLDAFYAEAMAAVEKEDWTQAVIALEKLQLLQPDYRDVSSHLVKARQRLGMREKGEATAKTGHVSLYVGGAFLALIVLPAIGMLIFSPTIRARFYLIRGNYLAAAQAYETLLARNPNRVKLYPPLANLYLLLGRHDQQALKIFKTILQLNLATNQREEINSIVAQNYLTEGRTDSDALEVLENALKSERQKQSQGNY